MKADKTTDLNRLLKRKRNEVTASFTQQPIDPKLLEITTAAAIAANSVSKEDKKQSKQEKNENHKEDANHYKIKQLKWESQAIPVMEELKAWVGNRNALEKKQTEFILSYKHSKTKANIALKLFFEPIKLLKPNKKTKRYYSYLFSNAQYHQFHSQSSKVKFKYCHLQVFDMTFPEKKEISLDVWFSTQEPSRFGELHDLLKTSQLSGDESMQLFDFLNQNYLKIKTLYVCDASRLIGLDAKHHEVHERAPGQVVFRVSMGVAYLQSLYERYGFEFMDLKECEAGWSEKKQLIAQDAKTMHQDRLILSQLKVIDFYQWLIETKDNEKAEKLKYFCKKYGNVDFEKQAQCFLTFGELTQLVLQESKKNRTKPNHLSSASSSVGLSSYAILQEDDFVMFYDCFLKLPDKVFNELQSGLLPEVEENDPKNEAVATKVNPYLKMNMFYNKLSSLVFARFLCKKTDFLTIKNAK